MQLLFIIYMYNRRVFIASKMFNISIERSKKILIRSTKCEEGLQVNWILTDNYFIIGINYQQPISYVIKRIEDNTVQELVDLLWKIVVNAFNK